MPEARRDMGIAAQHGLILGERYGFVPVPLVVKETDGIKDVQPFVAYADIIASGATFSVELFERLWDGCWDAPGMGILHPNVAQIEADSDGGEQTLSSLGVPRTVAYRRRRGPHFLFRLRPGHNLSYTDRVFGPGTELIVGRLHVLPPTPSYVYLPSCTPNSVDIAFLPERLLRQARRVSHPRTRVATQAVLEEVMADPTEDGARKLEAAAGTVAKASVGERNSTLYTASRKAGKLVGIGRVDETEATSALAQAAATSGEHPRKAAATIESGLNAGKVDPDRYFSKIDGFMPAVLGSEILAAQDVKIGPGHHLHRYRNGVYLPDGRELAIALTRRALGEKYKRAHGLEVVAWLQADMQAIGVDEEEASVPTTLNVANGMLDLGTATLLPHSPGFLSIVQIPVEWRPGAECSAVDQFLSEVLPEDAVAFAYEAVGYSLLAAQPLRVAVLLLGPGGNGKSTFLRMVARLLGRRNCSAVPLQLLGENRFSVAELYGKLANICGDLDSRALKSSDLFKTLTGNDYVRAERKYEHAFNFVSFATMFYSANEAPASSDQSDAYFDRWAILPFTRRFKDTPEEDENLLSKLTTQVELEGLLVRSVSALVDLLERGRFDVPESVRQAGKDYRERVDTVRSFLEQACDVGVGLEIDRGKLYEGYREWCGRNGRMPASNQVFSPRVRAILGDDVEEAWAHTKRIWKGLDLSS